MKAPPAISRGVKAQRAAIAVTLLALAAPLAAQAATRHDGYPLHAGRHASAGPRVAALQWLLQPRAPKQNVFKAIRGTFIWTPNGYFGARTKHAVVAYKFRLGYPKAGECGEPKSRTLLTPVAGADFVAFIRGKKTRPVCWVALAASRVQSVVVPGATPLALKIKAYELTQLGVHETCGGSCNRGPVVDVYERRFGLLGVAWCAVFQNYSFEQAGYRPIPFGAAQPFYVPSLAEWAAARNWLSAKPRVGDLIIFLSNDGLLVNAYHVGYVTKVTATGVSTVEGNSGDAVRENYYPLVDRLHAFISIPGVA